MHDTFSLKLAKVSKKVLYCSLGGIYQQKRASNDFQGHFNQIRTHLVKELELFHYIGQNQLNSSFIAKLVGCISMSGYSIILNSFQPQENSFQPQENSFASWIGTLALLQSKWTKWQFYHRSAGYISMRGYSNI